MSKLIPVLMILCIGFSGPCFANQRHHKHHMMSKQYEVKYLTKKLNLNAQQATDIKAINNRFKAQKKALKAQLKPLSKDMKKLMKEEAPNYSAIKANMEKTSAVHISLKLNHLKHREAIKAVLTDKQKAKFKKLKKHRSKKKKSRKSHTEKIDKDQTDDMMDQDADMMPDNMPRKVY